MQRLFPAVIVFAMVTPFLSLVGCGGGSTSSAISGANTTGPQISAVRYIDVDGNGVDRDDIVVVTFSGQVYVTSAGVEAFQFASALDTLGSGATLSQSVPGSATVELLLGVAPDLETGTSTLNVRDSGAVNIRDFGNDTVRPNDRATTVVDYTSNQPELVAVRYNDSDLSGTVNIGDTVVCEFDKPISIPSGATVANNFTDSSGVVVTSDTFGTSPSLTAVDASTRNRGALITLGSSPVFTVSGTYDASVLSAGSPSAIVVEAAGTVEITDTLSSGANKIEADTALDLAAQVGNRYFNAHAGSLFLGNVDSSSSGVRANGFYGPGGLHHYDGSVTVGSNTFSVDVLFVADTSNNRVLIFEDKPTGNNADASYVLGQVDFVSNLANRSTADDPPAAAATMWAPEDVHFLASSNQLFVSDTNNNRVLVWNDVLSSVDGMVALGDGQPADVVIGQIGTIANSANQGLTGPTSRTLSSPRGIHASGGQLAVADSGNSRVLIWGSIPATDNEPASTVLGQSNFLVGTANAGGTAAAGTLNAPEDVFLDPTMTVFNQNGAILVADTGNNRVLLYGTASPTTGASADMAYGQASLTGSGAATTAAGLDSPTGVTGLDGAGLAVTGRIWVADRDNHRVMVYTFNPDTASGATTTEPQTGDSGTAVGQAAATNGSENRGSGTVVPAADSFAFPARVAVSESAEGNLLVADRNNHRVLDFTTVPTADGSANIVQGQSSFTSSQANGHLVHEPTDGTVTAGKFIVADSANNRVLIFNTTPTASSASPDVIVGQNNVNQTQADQGSTVAADSMEGPQGVATDGTRLVIADTGNNRVLVFSTVPTSSGASAAAVLGQASATAELANTGGISGARMDSPVAVATSGTALIVCDRDNHRVLIFNDVTTVATGATADVVIGQDDFTSSAPNHGDVVTEYTLRTPVDVTVVGGRLYIVDQGNHRVLGYNSIPTLNGQAADFVLGQQLMTDDSAGTSTIKFNAPTAVGSDGARFFVADGGNNRVLLYTSPPVATNHIAAVVLGQLSFGQGRANRGVSAPSDTSLFTPRGLFFDGLDLWVADEDNSRVVRFR